jgi:ribosomal protein S18 acetylase RimI-like enzyme
MLDWRDATSADGALMARLDASAFAHLGGVPGVGDSLVAMQVRLRDQGWRAAWPDARCRVVEIETAGCREPVGRMWVNLGPGVLHLIEIALLPEQRRRGLGTRCLRRLLDEARAYGADMTLEVADDNPARHLYQRLGFDVIGERPPYLHLRRATRAESVNLVEVNDEQA